MTDAKHMPGPIVVWRVSRYQTASPERCEYDKETPHFYARTTGGRTMRDAKVSRWHTFYATEQEAKEVIAARNASERESRDRKAWEAAAINACEGVADPAVVPELVAFVADFIAVINRDGFTGDEPDRLHKDATTILAKATGGAA